VALPETRTVLVGACSLLDLQIAEELSNEVANMATASGVVWTNQLPVRFQIICDRFSGQVWVPKKAIHRFSQNSADLFYLKFLVPV